MHSSKKGPRLARAVVALVILASALQAQDNRDKTAPLRVPYATVPVRLDCGSDSSATWMKVPTTALSRASGMVVRVNKRSLGLEFLGTSRPVTAIPSTIESKLDSFHGQYGFQWDKNRLYGYVEIKEQDLDSRHPKVSEKIFRHSPYAAAFGDMFHSTVVVEVVAPSSRRWTTEMQVHVRPPNAKPMESMFFGRTNDEEQFRALPGEAVACPTDGGWVAKFAVAWLPFYDWHPKPGVTADLKLVAPLPHSDEGYVLVSIVPFVLTN